MRFQSLRTLLTQLFQCDGVTPCTRCTSDDAICTYGKHEKVRQNSFSRRVSLRSETINFSYRQFWLTVYSYVQMLERQHVQLIAGLQELYRRTQKATDGQGLLWN